MDYQNLAYLPIRTIMAEGQSIDPKTARQYSVIVPYREIYDKININFVSQNLSKILFRRFLVLWQRFIRKECHLDFENYTLTIYTPPTCVDDYGELRFLIYCIFKLEKNEDTTSV